MDTSTLPENDIFFFTFYNATVFDANNELYVVTFWKKSCTYGLWTPLLVELSFVNEKIIDKLIKKGIQLRAIFDKTKLLKNVRDNFTNFFSLVINFCILRFVIRSFHFETRNIPSKNVKARFCIFCYILYLFDDVCWFCIFKYYVALPQDVAVDNQYFLAKLLYLRMEHFRWRRYWPRGKSTAISAASFIKVITLLWNKALWLVVASHVTSF